MRTRSPNPCVPIPLEARAPPLPAEEAANLERMGLSGNEGVRVSVVDDPDGTHRVKLAAHNVIGRLAVRRSAN